MGCKKRENLFLQITGVWPRPARGVKAPVRAPGRQPVLGQLSEKHVSDVVELEVCSYRKGGPGPQRLGRALNLAAVGKTLKILLVV